MKRSTFPIRIAGLVGMIALLVVVVAQPAGALLYQEPTPRPTPTAAPYVELNPVQGIAGDATAVVASGALWTTGGTVTLHWDEVGGSGVELGQATVTNEGTFVIPFDTPTDPPHATVGVHTVYAVQGEMQAEAFFELIQGVPTDTPTPTYTPSPTNTATPPTPPTSTFTPPPTLTPTSTSTAIPSPTLRAVTPMVTISPIPPTRPPSVTRAPRPTSTRTPVPGPATNTPPPTITLVPTLTPGPGTPSVTPQATATPVDEMADTGAGWGTFILWGFVLAALLVVFRVLRVRSLPG
jgi:hypothetical protein